MKPKIIPYRQRRNGKPYKYKIFKQLQTGKFIWNVPKEKRAETVLSRLVLRKILD